MVAVLVIAGFVTQILVPFINGTPWFPIVRNSDIKSSLSDLEDKLEEAAEVAQIKERLSAVADKVNSKLNGKS
jgi:hypothetical protein